MHANQDLLCHVFGVLRIRGLHQRPAVDGVAAGAEQGVERSRVPALGSWHQIGYGVLQPPVSLKPTPAWCPGNETRRDSGAFSRGAAAQTWQPRPGPAILSRCPISPRTCKQRWRSATR